MGRIYIILGKPNSIERFDGTAGIHPCQVWYYYGDAAKRLPTYFGLIFFQRNGSGEYRLYNPLSDGPASLLVDTQGVDQTNAELVYEKVKELAPTLAGMTISLIPGQIPYGFMAQHDPGGYHRIAQEQPELRHPFSRVSRLREHRVQDHIENTGEAVVIRMPSWSFVHFSIVPKKISIDYYGAERAILLQFQAQRQPPQGREDVLPVLQGFPLYFPPANAEGIKANGVSVEDVFPVVEGTYSMTVLLQNAGGQGVQPVREGDHSPGAERGARVRHKLQDFKAEVNTPFKFEDKKIPGGSIGHAARGMMSRSPSS